MGLRKDLKMFQTKSLLKSINVSTGKITIVEFKLISFFNCYQFVFVSLTRTYCICVATKKNERSIKKSEHSVQTADDNSKLT